MPRLSFVVTASVFAFGCASSGTDDATSSLSGQSASESESDSAGTQSTTADSTGGESGDDTSSASDSGEESGGETEGDTDGDPGTPQDGWPIGIPYPDFGVDETVESVYGDADFYTHYVDNTGQCDDGGPGTDANPRCTLLLSGLAAGDVVYVAAGEYLLTDVGRGVMFDKLGEDIYILNNGIHGTDIGLDQYWREDFRLHIVNNIFDGVATPVKLESGSVAQVSQMRNNLVYNDGAAMNFEWGQQHQVSGSGDFDAMGAGVSENLVGDPQFQDAANGDFRVPMGSPAVNAGTSMVVEERFDAFEQEYGESIAFDYGEDARPASDWDIGPFER